MSSAPANTADITSMCVAHSHDSVVPPYLLATNLSAAAQSYNHTAVLALQPLHSAFYLPHSLSAETFLL